MIPATTEYAGGVVTATLADNDNAQNVFGCKAVRQSTGSVFLRTTQIVPFPRARCWVQVYAPQAEPYFVTVRQLSPTDWLILTYALGTEDDPVGLTETPTNYDFAFGISALPDG